MRGSPPIVAEQPPPGGTPAALVAQLQKDVEARLAELQLRWQEELYKEGDARQREIRSIREELGLASTPPSASLGHVALAPALPADTMQTLTVAEQLLFGAFGASETYDMPSNITAPILQRGDVAAPRSPAAASGEQPAQLGGGPQQEVVVDMVSAQLEILKQRSHEVDSKLPKIDAVIQDSRATSARVELLKQMSHETAQKLRQFEQQLKPVFASLAAGRVSPERRLDVSPEPESERSLRVRSPPDKPGAAGQAGAQAWRS